MGFNFDKRSAERIAKEVRSHERRVRGVRPPIRNWDAGASTSSLSLGKVTMTVTARSESDELGAGKVQIFDVDDSNTLTLLDDEIDVLNFWATEISSGEYVLLGDSTGGLFVLGRECSEIDDDLTEGV